MKKIFLLFALIILFFPTTSLLAGDSPMGTNCKNDDDCAVGMCMDSDIDLPEDNFCVCGNATDCEKTYGKDQGETWTCNVPNDTSNDLAYCKSDTKGIQSPFSVGQIAAQKAKEAAGGDDSKQMPYPLQPPKINVPFDTLQPFSTAMVTPGEAVSIPWMAQYIIAVYRYAIIIGSILAVIVIMIGGILYLTAGGIPNNVKKAGSLIFGAIIGLVLLLSSHLILNTINPNLTQLSTLSIGTIKGVEFPDESSADVYTDSIDITNAEISVGQNPELLVAGQFGSLNIAGTCTPQEIISVAKTLITKKVCQGPCHCASTAFRILRLAGCNTKMSGSANGGKSALEKSTWITKPCTDFPAEKIPVGYLWKDGHAMISIGGGQLVESSTDITKCWKSQKAAKTCKAKGEKEFDQCAIENGECPKSNQLAVGQAYCNSCSLISGEGPETCRFSNGQGCKGGGTCVSNQCIYKSGLGRIKKIYNSCTITYKPGWETSGNVTYSDSVSESSESIGSSGH